jgi:hypothetical protein
MNIFIMTGYANNDVCGDKKRKLCKRRAAIEPISKGKLVMRLMF